MGIGNRDSHVLQDPFRVGELGGQKVAAPLVCARGAGVFGLPGATEAEACGLAAAQLGFDGSSILAGPPVAVGAQLETCKTVLHRPLSVQLKVTFANLEFIARGLAGRGLCPTRRVGVGVGGGGGLGAGHRCRRWAFIAAAAGEHGSSGSNH